MPFFAWDPLHTASAIMGAALPALYQLYLYIKPGGAPDVANVTEFSPQGASLLGFNAIEPPVFASSDLTRPFHPFLGRPGDDYGVSNIYKQVLDFSYDLQPLIIWMIKAWEWLLECVFFTADHPMLITIIAFLALALCYSAYRLIRSFPLALSKGQPSRDLVPLNPPMGHEMRERLESSIYATDELRNDARAFTANLINELKAFTLPAEAAMVLIQQRLVAIVDNQILIAEGLNARLQKQENSTNELDAKLDFLQYSTSSLPKELKPDRGLSKEIDGKLNSLQEELQESMDTKIDAAVRDLQSTFRGQIGSVPSGVTGLMRADFDGQRGPLHDMMSRLETKMDEISTSLASLKEAMRALLDVHGQQYSDALNEDPRPRPADTDPPATAPPFEPCLTGENQFTESPMSYSAEFTAAAGPSSMSPPDSFRRTIQPNFPERELTERQVDDWRTMPRGSEYVNGPDSAHQTEESISPIGWQRSAPPTGEEYSPRTEDIAIHGRYGPLPRDVSPASPVSAEPGHSMVSEHGEDQYTSRVILVPPAAVATVATVYRDTAALQYTDTDSAQEEAEERSSP